MNSYLSSHPIGVFDSGVGGLSVLLELERLMPNESFVFVADQSFVPYGEKTREQLIERSTKICSYLIVHHRVKAVVVACNTATCYAIGELRERFDTTPIIGTEPAVKPAVEHSKAGAKQITVLSTPATARSQTLRDLVQRYAVPESVGVLLRGCPGLEEAVENGGLDHASTLELVKENVRLATSSGSDCIVLGCTHYPFLTSQIQKIAGSQIKIFDSGKAIAKQTESILLKNNLREHRNTRGYRVFFTTGHDLQKFTHVATRLMERPIVGRPLNL